MLFDTGTGPGKSGGPEPGPAGPVDPDRRILEPGLWDGRPGFGPGVPDGRGKCRSPVAVLPGKRRIEAALGQGAFAEFGLQGLAGCQAYDGYIGLYDEYVINLDERCFARLLNKESFEKAKKYVDEHTDIIHFNGKFKPWKSDYKGELDGYWHHFDRMPSYKARRYYSETA